MITKMKSRLCCLPVVVATTLCSYLNVVDHKYQEKAKIILRKLNTPEAIDEASQYYKERYVAYHLLY